jgi:LacI family transcriptional regulator
MVVTTKDIARICGISRATVDRALNGKTGIKEETRELILKKAEELGYRPDLLARSLVKGKTMTLGIVVFDVRNRYFAQMLNTIELEAKKRGYFVYITLTEKDPNTEKKLIHQLIDRRVDGLILSPINKSRDFEEYFRAIGTPIVTVGNRISSKWHHVGINDRKATRDGLDYILSKKYRRVIFLCPPLVKRKTENIYAQEERAESFVEYFKGRTDIESEVVSGWDFEEAIIDFTAGRRKTALFCSSDTYALSALEILKKNGRKAPDDIGLMGFDNIDFMQYISPRVATIDSPIEAQAVLAVESLVRLIAGEAVPKLQYIPHSIVEGDSL